MGLSFAIPIDVALDISNQTESNGENYTRLVGVIAIQEITKELQSRLV